MLCRRIYSREDADNAKALTQKGSKMTSTKKRPKAKRRLEEKADERGKSKKSKLATKYTADYEATASGESPCKVAFWISMMSKSRSLYLAELPSAGERLCNLLIL